MDPLIGRILLERYEVLRKIGSGGMGAVYSGRQLAVGREVALKILRADLISNEHVRERFRREAAIIGKLRHPNTIQLIDYGETEDGFAVMVTELLVGLALSDRLRQLGPMPVRDAIEVARQVASSLAEAHALGMVHRDLKPANIFLVEVAGRIHAKVLDFGIARVLDEESTRITSTGQVFGTPRYMSPEQGMASGEVDHRADLYSLGLILFECLVGQPPFVANTSIQYLSAHMTQPPPRLHEHLPGAPAELDALVSACLVKDREQRVQSADELERILRRIGTALDSHGDTAELAARAATAPRPSTGVTSGALPLPATMPPGVATAGVTTGLAPARASKPKLVPLLAVSIALLAAAGAAGAAYWSAKEDAEAVTFEAVSPDAAAVALGAPDAAPLQIAMADLPDAGLGTHDSGLDVNPAEDLEGSPDAGEASVQLAETKTKAKDRRNKTKRKGREKTVDNGGANAVMGGVTGPRAMWIPTNGEDSGPIEAAKACKTSALGSGPAKLTLKPCAKNCAVIIDGTCAGRTPLEELAVPNGNKNVTVVCGTAVVIDQIARLRPGETTTLSCR